jgi:peroxiredoxin Q/BCP
LLLPVSGTTPSDLYDQKMIEQGQQAPDFELPDQDGRIAKLSDYRGTPVVVYFYPKADTPGCTTQACGVRDHEADYSGVGATVLGISPDPVAKVKKFHDKQALNFTLLADEDHAVAEAYGVWVEKSMYGRKYMGAERTTYVIGPDGVISHVLRKVKPVDAGGTVARVLRKVKPAEHDEQVLKALAEVTPPVV